MIKIRAAMALAALSPDDARQIYISDVQARRVGYKSLLELGWEEVDPACGRDILWANGRAMALKDEVRQRLVAEAAEREQAKAQYATDRPKITAKPGESLASVLCPACQSIMAKSPICPNCAKGKAGFKILCICTECSHEVYL